MSLDKTTVLLALYWDNLDIRGRVDIVHAVACGCDNPPSVCPGFVEHAVEELLIECR